MQIDRSDLERAVDSGIVSGPQADALWCHLTLGEHRSEGSPRSGDGRRPAKGRKPIHPLLVGASAVSFWAASMASAAAAFAWASTHPGRGLVSGLVGVIFLAAGFGLDARALHRHASYLHFLGLVSIVGGVATSGGERAVSLPLPLAVGTILVYLGIVLRRRSFAIAGALSLAGAAGQLADDLLADAVFPVALAGIGIAFAAAAVIWHGAVPRAGDLLFSKMPAPLRRALEPARQA